MPGTSHTLYSLSYQLIATFPLNRQSPHASPQYHPEYSLHRDPLHPVRRSLSLLLPARSLSIWLLNQHFFNVYAFGCSYYVLLQGLSDIYYHRCTYPSASQLDYRVQ